MNPNMCNHCGGSFEYRKGRWICRACGSYKPEELSNEEVTLLYTAYQKLRLAEFEDAELEFDDIIVKFPENPNAYWGRLMSKYGIKYEVDYDGRMIPTCYATSIESVMSDKDYQRALQYADEENREYYRTQAEYIERVRREWVEKAKREKPYDIFICYKDSDLANDVKRTQDSYSAQELYTHLTEQGYRVFYSHNSLKDKVGEKYEPYIFSALSTAKVMLVYGSKPEYITSTWLKNEWTRYEKRIRLGEKKPNSLLVACEGFSPMELPAALRSRQCFDACDKSFYGDLDAVIYRILHDKSKPAAIPAPPKPSEKAKSAPPRTGKKKKWIIPAAASFALVIALVSAILLLGGNHKPSDPGNPSLCEHVPQALAAVAPTCTSAGLSEGSACSLCGEVLQEQQTLGALGHTPDTSKICTVGTTCSVCDAKLADKQGHKLSAAPATCITGKVCSVCSEELSAPTGHKVELWTSGDYVRYGTCGICETSVHEVVKAFTGEYSNGLKYTKNSDHTYTVSGIGTCTDTHIVIPPVYNGLPVKDIAPYAFAGQNRIQGLTISWGITELGNYAFNNCSGLVNISIPESIAQLGDCVFTGCSALTAIDLPSGVQPPKSGWGSMFEGCASLKSFTAPDTMNHLDGNTFSGCASLETLTLPKEFHGITGSALSGCENLSELRFKGNVAAWPGKTQLAEDWYQGTKLTKVICADGEISLVK